MSRSLFKCFEDKNAFMKLYQVLLLLHTHWPTKVLINSKIFGVYHIVRPATRRPRDQTLSASIHRQDSHNLEVHK